MTNEQNPLRELSQQIVQSLSAHGLTCATAESCTGGLVAASITSVPGASGVFPGGAVTYNNAMKQKILSVYPGILAEFSAISPQTAAAMAEGVRGLTGADIGVSVTGNAGPEPSEGKPVGTVFLGIDSNWTRRTELLKLPDPPPNREAIRQAAVHRALELILETAQQKEQLEGR